MTRYCIIIKTTTEGDMVTGCDCAFCKEEAEDEVGYFWMVTRPTATSEIADIVSLVSARHIALLVAGGLKPSDIMGTYISETKAVWAAKRLLTHTP